MKYQPGTFTVIPNKEYLKEKPPILQCLFFWLCQHSDEKGVCFPSRSTLAKEVGCDIRSIDKYIKIMESDNILKKTTRFNKRKKKNDSNLYQIMLSEPISLGSESNTLGSESNEALTITNNYTDLTKKKTIVDDVDKNQPFILSSYLEEVMGKALTQKNSENLARYFSALFIKRKGLVRKDKKSTDETIGRWLKDGRSIAQHCGDMERVKWAFKEAENMCINGRPVDWTLKTVADLLAKR
jgi:hypothetical protein